MKADKANRPPAGEAWVWLTREMLKSDAWRSLSINAGRVVYFLMLEHMSKGARHNGKLKAPHRQLMQFGIGARFVTDAIREAEELGFVDCNRGGLRVATTYGLTWLPLHDSTLATNRWRTYRNPALLPVSEPKSRNLPNKGEAGLPNKGEADDPNLPNKGEADDLRNLPNKGEALIRKLLTKAGDVDTDLSERGCGLALRAAVVPLVSKLSWSTPTFIEIELPEPRAKWSVQ